MSEFPAPFPYPPAAGYTVDINGGLWIWDDAEGHWENVQGGGPGSYEPLIPFGTVGQYWRGDKVWTALDKAAVGLANVDNTSDANKPVSTAQATALAGKEPSLPAGGTTSNWLRGDRTWQPIAAGGLDTEAVQDVVGAMVGTSGGLTSSYNDTAGTVTIDGSGKVAKVGDKMTGALEIEMATPNLTLDNTSAAGTNVAEIDFARSGKLTWAINTWNPGDHFSISRYDDAGAYIGHAIELWRDDAFWTFYGNAEVNKNEPRFYLVKQASGQELALVGMKGGTARWWVNVADLTPETGANSGSNFSLDRFTDAGGFIDSALVVNRATGIADFKFSPTAPTLAVGTNTTQLATTAYVKAEMAAVGAGISDAPNDAYLYLRGQLGWHSGGGTVSGWLSTEAYFECKAPDLFGGYMCSRPGVAASYSMDTNGYASINSTSGYINIYCSGTQRVQIGGAGLMVTTGAGGYTGDFRAVNVSGSGGVIGFCNGTTNYGIVGYRSGTTIYGFFGNAQGVTTGGWTTSDERFKNVKLTKEAPVDALAVVAAIPVKAFSWKQDTAMGRAMVNGDDYFGWLAQDVEPVLPQAVHDVLAPEHDLEMRAFLAGEEIPEEKSAKAEDLAQREDLTFKTINEHFMIATLWRAVQELTQRVADQDARLKTLEGAA